MCPDNGWKIESDTINQDFDQEVEREEEKSEKTADRCRCAIGVALLEASLPLAKCPPVKRWFLG